jgi:hypothetical protein
VLKEYKRPGILKTSGLLIGLARKQASFSWNFLGIKTNILKRDIMFR